MKIKEAQATGLCKICGSGRNGKCLDQEMKSLNYRNVAAVECALTEEEIRIMKRERGMK